MKEDDYVDVGDIDDKMSLFQVPSIEEWLVSQLQTGDLISADPRIISYAEWNNWDDYFSKLYVHMSKIML